MITAFLQVLVEDTYCIDILNVASSPYLWGEWIACSPLLIYSNCLITAEELTKHDIGIIASYSFSVVLGFLFFTASSKALAQFLLTIAFLTFIPLAYIPFCEPILKIHPFTKLDLPEGIKETIFAEKRALRKTLSIVLCIILPSFPLIYLLGLFNAINYESTIIAYKFFSIFTKGIFVEVCSGSYIYMITKIEDILVEERNTNILKRDFTNYIFHEIRTPFNSISVAIDLLQEFDSFTNTQTTYLKTIRDSCDSISETLNSVLTIQQLEENIIKIDLEFCDLTNIFDKAFKFLNSMVEQKEISISFNVSSNAPKLILIDGKKFEHVIINLVACSIKITPVKGRITINVDFEFRMFIKSNLRVPERILEFIPNSIPVNKVLLMKVSIINNEHEYLSQTTKKLFKPLANSLQTYSRNSEVGLVPNTTGMMSENFRPESIQNVLGLSFCKTIVELHNGEVGVYSDEDQGTAFRFVIPIQDFQYEDTCIHSKSNVSQSNVSQSNVSQSNVSQSNVSQSNVSQSNVSQSNVSQSNVSQSNDLK
jgi:signal transduction histidine kinase